jgi:hypothetical protein
MDRAITVTAAELVERRYSARLVELNDLINNQLNDDIQEIGEALVEREAVRAAMRKVSELLSQAKELGS